MPALPRILIIDDLLGAEPPLPYRVNFCAALALRDTSTPLDPNRQYLAEVTFHSGQRVHNGWTDNDPEGALEATRSGWPFADGGRWALVCLDLNFNVGPTGELVPSAFGLELLEKMQADPQLCGDRDPGPVIVMLSVDKPDDVEELAFKRRTARSDRQDVHFFAKWNGDRENEYRSPSHKFAALLFDKGLVEDGALRFATKDGVVSPIARDGPLIVGSSLALLRAMRTARASLANPKLKHFLIVGEPGDDADVMVQYIHDHWTVARASIHSGAPVGKVSLFDLKGGAKPKPGTLRIDHIERHDAAGWSRLVDILDGKDSRFEKGLHQVVALTSSEAVADLQSNPVWRNLTRGFVRVVWPPLRDRPDDIGPLFRRLLEAEDGAERAATRIVEEDAIRALCGQRWPDNLRELGRVAAIVAEDARQRTTVRVSHVVAAIETVEADSRVHRISSLVDLLSEMKAFRFKTHELEGAWPKLAGAFTDLLTSLFEKAELVNTKRGKLNVTAVGRLIGGLPRDGEGDETHRFVKRMHKHLHWDGPTVDKFLKEDPVESEAAAAHGDQQ